MVQKSLSNSAHCRCDFRQPDHGFYRFNLAEKRLETSELVVTPMLQEPGRLGRHSPLCFRKCPPFIDGAADAVDDLYQFVLLLLGFKTACGLIKRQFALGSFLFLGFWDRRNERDAATMPEYSCP